VFVYKIKKHSNLQFRVQSIRKINKAVLLSSCRRQGGEEYSSYSILISALERVKVVSITPQPHFTPGKGTSVLTGQEAGWASELVWTQKLEEKSFFPARDRTPVVQSAVRHYTDSYPALRGCHVIFCSKKIVVHTTY
jgi:hypothetical protein